jgi:TolA-binding protein
VAASALVASVFVACAYYNTLYNAKEKFREAERASERAASTPQARPTTAGASNPNARLYEEVVEKCKTMIANYPKSRHVDDAMLLSARALFALERYDEAVAAIDTLQASHPKSDLKADAGFLKGKSLAAAGKFDLAVPVLRDYADRHGGHDDHAEALYLLCACLMQLGSSDDAVQTLERLEKEHGRSEFRFKAQVEMARILAEKELYDESLAVYKRLNESRIPASYRYDVWLGMATVQESVGDHAGVIQSLSLINTLPRAPDKEARSVLLRARAHGALDSTDTAVAEYMDVTKRFGNGAYGAEAYYRLGHIYEAQDSLEKAQRYYQQVPRAYSNSDYAEDAIKRSSDIGRVLKLQAMEGNDSPEAVSMRTFSMAEIQLFQFNNTEKAIASYEKVVNEFPDTEFAPRAAYALGYINGVVLGDSVKARHWYEVLRSRYGNSHQALLAYSFYKSASQPTYEAFMDEVRGAAAHPDSTQPATHTPADTTKTTPPPPPPSTKAPAPPDTTAAPADTSRG